MTCTDVDESSPEYMLGVLQGVCLTLEEVQKTPRRCREYALALTKLEEAQHWLQAVKG